MYWQSSNPLKINKIYITYQNPIRNSQRTQYVSIRNNNHWMLQRQIFPICFTFHEEFFSVAQQPLVDQGSIIIKSSLSHSVRHNTLSRTPLDKWSVQRRDLYQTAHNTRKIRTRNPSKPAAADPRLRLRSHMLQRREEHKSQCVGKIAQTLQC